MYKVFDTGHRYIWFGAGDDKKTARLEVTLDVSAYLSAGYTLESGSNYFVENPRCEFEWIEERQGGKAPPKRQLHRLAGVTKGAGIWTWSAEDVSRRTVGIAWELNPADAARRAKLANLESLSTELGIDPRLAKDLHNFVMICHYYVAGYRSMNSIGPAMMGSRSMLNHSIRSLRKAIGLELIRRTKGKGLIEITPAGEAVLDWWSQFYMRWTPISPFVAELNGPAQGEPAGRRRTGG